MLISSVNKCGNFGGNGDGFGGGPGRGPVLPLPSEIDPNITLASVGGLEEQIRYLQRSIIYPLKHQGSLDSWGIEAPKGVMFYGPPGTGKTLLAKALANELSRALKKKFSFFYQKGGECFGKWFGESERTLRQLFFAAQHYKPSIIFFDEIDGLCPDRAKSALSSTAYASVVTALLGLMDSVKRGDVFIIGATNRLDAVDAAVRRPGRFDKQLGFSLPNEEQRKGIILIHCKDWPRDKPDGQLLNDLAKKTNGYTGADLEKACRETVVAAMSRAGDVPSNSVRITRDDWAAALSAMKPTSTNVFGSTLFIAQPLAPFLAPLVSNIIDEVVALLQPLVPPTHWVAISTSKRKQEKDSGGKVNKVPGLCHNSLLVWNNAVETDTFTSQMIMKGVLGHKSLEKMTTYILDKESLLKNVGYTTVITKFNGIVQQALNSDKPCILFIPQIHAIETVMKTLKVQSAFHRQLLRLRGSNVILLATSVGPLDKQSPELLGLFKGQDRAHRSRLPNKPERKAFFLKQIFHELMANENVPNKKAKPSQANEDYADHFKEQLKLVVQLTENDIFEYMMNLHGALWAKKAEWKEGKVGKKALHAEFKSILQEYSKTKLM